MKIPQLQKKPELKSCHNKTWEDNYSWIHQENILEVLKDKNRLDPEVKEYLIQENNYTSLKEMGALMKIIKEKYTGKIDMGLVGKIAKSLLGN